MNPIDSQSSYLLARNVNAEYNLSEPALDNMYAPEAYPFDSSMQSYLDAPDFSHPRASQDVYSTFAGFTGGPVYPEAAHHFVHGKHSPHLSPFESPEMRAPSNLSTASGPSATSSAMGSPYSNPGQTVSVPEWGSGLGISPSIAGGPYDSYSHEFSYRVSGMDELSFPDVTKSFVDPSLIHQYTGPPVQTPMAPAAEYEYQTQTYAPHSPTPSNISAQSSSRPIKRSQSPYLSSYQTYPYPPRRPSLMSHQSYGSQDGSFDSDESAKGKCPNPDCGKIFKDLKAHMLTHMNERPEKCPITTCDYHIKGFARKYDKNRHTLTHYKGTMVCGFCPGSGSSAEKSFNRADVFKRHLTSVHAVEQTPPNSRKKTSGGVNAGKKLAGYAPDATGKCSTCSAMFQNAQDFYEHLDDCVLRIVQQEEPSEAINAQRLAEVENDPAVHQTLRHNGLPITTINHFSADEEEDEEEYDDADDDDYTARGSKARRATKTSRISPNGSVQKSRSGALTHSKGGVTLHTKGRKKRKDYPNSWGCPTPQMKMKKRVMCAFDGTRRLWKDDMMLSTDYEVRIPLSDGKSYVTDLDIQTLKRAEAFHSATEEEKGPYEEEMDLEKLMEVKSERSTSADTLS